MPPIDKLKAETTVDVDALAEFKEGVAYLKNGYPQKALIRLRRAFESERQNPFYLSFLGLSIARSEKKWDQAVELCEIAVQLRRREAQFYLNLAEVYASSGRRMKALDTLDSALALFGEDERLRYARSRVEKRRSPLFPFLRRDHLLNRKLGRLRHRILKRLGKENI
ncbi:MAG TPA: tetratricopeptide repeat protein [Verrucomicrobiae bacterium]|nr:tetratricopeptide repeat protein [Verrucomicrobiae bacterium]